VIEDVTLETETTRGKTPTTSEVFVLSVRPKSSLAGWCSRCRRRCPGYDGGDGVRWWRTRRRDDEGVSAGRVPQVECPEDGVVAHVPWARPGARHTWLFDDTCA
jgi:transposase